MAEEKKLLEEVIMVNKVTKVTSGGRQLRFQAIVIVGDQQGSVGFGIGKAGEVVVAVQKAVSRAKRNMIKVDLALGTIPHPIRSKYKSSKVLLMPAAPGTGIIAGGVVRKIISMAGYHNILSKSQGSNNKLNTTKATIFALQMLKGVHQNDYRLEQAKVEKEMIRVQQEKAEAKKNLEDKSKDKNSKGGRFGKGKKRPFNNRSEAPVVEDVTPGVESEVVVENDTPIVPENTETQS